MPEISEERLAELEAKAAKAEQLEKDRSEQNSYITKLEGERNAYKSQAEQVKEVANQAPSFDPLLMEHIKNDMHEKVTRKAIEAIIEQYKQPVYDAVKKEFEAILNDISEKNYTVQYITTRFKLLIGEYMADPTSEVFKLITGTNPAPKVDEPKPNLEPEPPVMNNQDKHVVNSNNDLPDRADKATSTKDALTRFRNKYNNSL